MIPGITASVRRAGHAGGDPFFANVQLLLHLDGEDGATSTTDSSSAGRTVTFSGNAQLDTAQAKWGPSSLLLDGSGDSISVADADSLSLGSSDFTLEAWVRPASVSGTFRPIMGHWTPTGNQRAWLLYLTGGTSGRGPAFFWSPNGSTPTFSVTGTFEWSTNTWYHVAACRSGTNLRLFVDGTLIASGDIGTTSIHNSTTLIRIGQGSTSEFLNGWIDDVRLTIGVARYTSNFSPPAGPFPDAAP